MYSLTSQSSRVAPMYMQDPAISILEPAPLGGDQEKEGGRERERERESREERSRVILHPNIYSTPR